MSSDLLNSLRTFWYNLNERERKLVAILGTVAAVLVVFVPVYLVGSDVSDLRTENEAIRDVLRDMEKDKDKLAERIARKRAMERLLANPAPPLGSFVETQAQEAGIKLRGDVTDQPEKSVSGFRRRSVRVKLPGIGLRSLIPFMTSIENSGYPVIIDLIHIEHYQPGDQYNVELGVVAFDRVKSRSDRNSGNTDTE